MRNEIDTILTINGGSSSIKFALFANSIPPQRQLSGKIDRIGLSGTTLTSATPSTHQPNSLNIDAGDHRVAAIKLIDWLENHVEFTRMKAIGHRIVHGMQHTIPELVTSKLLEELQHICAFDPEHLPGEIELIEVFRRRYPSLPQIACFNTAFHYAMPRVAKLLPLPRRFDARGIQRYGFHGLSYAYLIQTLEHVAGRQAARGRVILAHLGNGASLAAVHAGQSIDTSMGLTPCGGVCMGTRTGDLDPGVAWYLLQNDDLKADQFNHLINHESGLLGVSETSSDMRDLLIRETTDARAAEAIQLFCYQVKKCIGAFAAALGGLDTLVFSGGIGANAAAVRTRICAGLEFLGIAIDEKCNSQNEEIISTPTSRVTVRVIQTDEEVMIATQVNHLLAKAH